MITNYQDIASAKKNDSKKINRISRESIESMGALKRIKKRGEKRKNMESEKVETSPQAINPRSIGNVMKELLERSDIIDEEFGKSITLERFITAAVIYGVPTFS